VSYRASGKLADFGLSEPMEAAAMRTAERVGQDLLERVKGHTPIAKPPPGHEAEWLAARKRLPGTLRDSWKCGEVEVVNNGRTYTIDVYTNDRVAPDVEWPTRPHMIAPAPGSMLRFWTSAGETVFARIVHHPGTQGSYMLTTSIAEVAVAWQQIGAEEMDQWARDQAALLRV
jgi:hypothetical protein